MLVLILPLKTHFIDKFNFGDFHFLQIGLTLGCCWHFNFGHNFKQKKIECRSRSQFSTKNISEECFKQTVSIRHPPFENYIESYQIFFLLKIVICNISGKKFLKATNVEKIILLTSHVWKTTKQQGQKQVENDQIAYEDRSQKVGNTGRSCHIDTIPHWFNPFTT